MITLENLQILWFVLVAVLFIGYSLLDGFDLGIGILLPFLGKTREEKDRLINSIGPVWDGNEVWLITGGGALFAAFPNAYATAFSGFYLAMMLVLFSLIFRAVSFEFRAYNVKHSTAWEWALTLGSFFPALLFGVALGNVVAGVPLDANMEYTGSFFTLLRPLPLLFGILGLSGVVMHGAAYAVLKTEGALQKRALIIVKGARYVFTALGIIFAIVMALYFSGAVKNALFIAGVILFLAGTVSAILFLKNNREGRSFIASSVSGMGLWLAVAVVHFPNLIRASNDPELSITIHNASSGFLTLKLMSVIALVGMPVVIGYTIYVYRIFKGKTGTDSGHY
jgi:cytochrome bd ubiquinol oxidase subunit II